MSDASVENEQTSKRRTESFARFIKKVNERVNGKRIISTPAMVIFNSLVYYLFERIATASSLLCEHAEKATLTHEDIVTAVKLVIRGDHAQHALDFAVAAYKKYAEEIK